jgi:hypothetical protein
MQSLDRMVRRAHVRDVLRAMAGRLGLFCGAVAVALVALVTMPVQQASAGFERFWEEGDAAQQPRQRRSRTATRSSSRRSVYANGGRRSRGLRRAAQREGNRYARKGSRRRVKVASLGKDDYSGYGYGSPKAKISGGGGVRWVASSGCLAGSLASVIHQVAANFGPVTVNSTCRSRARNARVGGAHKSLHLTGNAVDFRVRGNVSAVYAYLRSSGSVGGLKHYGGGLFHIDTGARRSW